MTASEPSPSSEALCRALERTLDRICGPLSNGHHEWYLIGSMTALIHGAEHQPNDVAIMTRRREAAELIHDLDAGLRLFATDTGLQPWRGKPRTQACAIGFR